MKIELNTSEGKHFAITLIAQSKADNQNILDIAMQVNKQSTYPDKEDTKDEVKKSSVVKTKHKTNPKKLLPIPCPACGRIFVGRVGLASHLVRSKECSKIVDEMKKGGEIDMKKPHKCKICGKGFARSAGLFIHMGHKHTREERDNAYRTGTAKSTEEPKVKTNFLELVDEPTAQVIK